MKRKQFHETVCLEVLEIGFLEKEIETSRTVYDDSARRAWDKRKRNIVNDYNAEQNRLEEEENAIARKLAYLSDKLEELNQNNKKLQQRIAEQEKEIENRKK